MEHTAPSSIFALVGERPGSAEPEIALVAPGRPDLTYGGLSAHVRRTAGVLRAAGLGPADRIALVVENGPEAATAFLAIASAGVCAPLNPAYRAEELEFYLRDLGARAVVVAAARSNPPPATSLARSGVDVLELHVDPARPAGVFELMGERASAEASELAEGPEGNATRSCCTPPARRPGPRSSRWPTGTCSRRPATSPATLALTPSDRCLNVMPLFHIHGLVAGAPRLARRRWLGRRARPASTQRPLLRMARGARSPPGTPRCRRCTRRCSSGSGASRRSSRATALRFVRSSSAALPATCSKGSRRLLRCPVLEAYGMTEAAHQMASNPLPPGAAQARLGRPAGWARDRDSRRRRRRCSARRGGRGRRSGASNVFDRVRGQRRGQRRRRSATAGSAPATRACLDEDGYLSLTGRLKEIINRGGEKVSPLEIDEVLLRHPAVRPGGDVRDARRAARRGGGGRRRAQGTAARGRGGSRPSGSSRTSSHRQWRRSRCPAEILLVDEIPKGPTGKVQRVGLAGQLDLTRGGTGAAPAATSVLLEIRGARSGLPSSISRKSGRSTTSSHSAGTRSWGPRRSPACASFRADPTYRS